MSLMRPNYGATICRFCGMTEDQHTIDREQLLDSGQTLYCCGHCASAYLCPDLPATTLDHFYREHYRQLFPFMASDTPDERLLLQMRSRELALHRARRLAQSLPHHARVLEIGSGHGAFLGSLHALRDDLQLFAVEPGHAERTLALDGAPVRFIELEQIDQVGTLDLIALFHTFEHLVDPVGVLRRLAAVSTPESRLAIEVPDAFIPGATWTAVHPAHTCYFSADGLQRVIRLGGWEPVAPTNCTAGNLYQEARPAEEGSTIAPVTLAQREAFLQQARDAQRTPVSSTRRMRLKALQSVLGADRVGRLSRWRHERALDQALSTPTQAIVLGAPVSLVTQEQVIQRALDSMKTRRSLRLADVNTAKLIDLQEDAQLRQALFRAELCVADGMGVVWAARGLGIPVPQRVTGIDTMHALLQACAIQGLRPYLLGARSDVIEETVRKLQHSYPTLQLAGWHHGYFSAEQEPQLFETLRDSGADCLIVGLPTPNQDLFLSRVQARLDIPFLMGVGGSFDVLAGRLRRAPLWMQRAGCEWVFRLLQEPRRLLKRYVTSNSRLIMLWLPAWLAKHLFG